LFRHLSKFEMNPDYLFMTYIVTSKPKRISVAAGLVHMIVSFDCLVVHRA
jgi:hypothetical protein